ncbi:MAG: PAS domain-containing protein [Ignavibacteria bacterium]|nr:PAS domain-containing protein [Ignavibacteria bacterium]
MTRSVNQSFYEDLLREIPIGLAIFDFESKKILESNTYFREILNYNEDEIKDLNLYDLETYGKERLDKFLENIEINNTPFEGGRILKRKDNSEIFIFAKITIPNFLKEKVIVYVVEEFEKKKSLLKHLPIIEDLPQVILENLPIAFYTTESPSVSDATWISDNIKKITGYDKEQFIKIPHFWESNLHPDERENVIKLYRAGLKQDYNELTYRFKTSSGDYIWLSDRYIVKETDKEGRKIIVGALLDVSMEKIAEIALKDSESKFQTLVKNIPGVVYRCELDFPWQMFFISPEIENLCGVKAEEFMNGTIKYADIIHQEDLEYVIEEVKKGVKGKRSFKLEYRIIHKNGSIHYVYEKGRALYDKNDKPLFLDGVILDITETKLMEIALRQSEEKFRNLIENMQEGYYRSTPDGHFLEVNNAMVKILGYDSKEELMKVYIPLDLYFDPAEREEYEKVNIDFIPDLEVYRLKRKDGSEVWIEEHARYIRDEKGNILYHEGICRDVTERIIAERELRKAKEKAEEASRVKSNFLANMSHELRTPLVGILGFSEILSKESNDPEVKQFAEYIHNSGMRLLETVNLILDLSKIESDKLYISMKRSDVLPLIDEIVNLFSVAAKNKNLYLRKETNLKSLFIKNDEILLRSAISNLVNNAIKFTEKGGIIIRAEVEQKKDDNFAVIKVIDTGIGIPKESLNVIFEEFRQVSEGPSRSFEGSGLGLTITKKFVEKMNGTIEVESELGKGSTFTLRFPYSGKVQFIDKKLEEKKEMPTPVETVEEKEHLPTILLVEDDDASIQIVKEYLKGLCNIDVVFTAEACLEKIKHYKYPMIIMDINLGRGMNGSEATKIIRKIPEYKDTPIIAMTAFAMIGDREEFLEAGCTDYISKPFIKKGFVKLIKEYLDKIK